MLVNERAGKLVDGVIRAIGWSPAAYALTEQDRSTFTDAANEALRTAWGRQKWPLLMRVEARRFRPTWAAGTAYAAGNEVWHAGTAAYWRCLTGDTGTAPGTDAAVWERPEEFIPFVQLVQPWEAFAIAGNGFDLNAFAWEKDPRVNPGLAPIRGCTLWMESVVLPQGVPAEVYVKFLPVCPKLDFTEWAAGTAYDAGEVCFRTVGGRCWSAVRDNIGVTPGTSGADWVEVGVPEFMLRYVRLEMLRQWRTEDAGRFYTDGDAEKALAAMEREAFEGSGVAQGARWGGFRRRM